MLQMKPFVSNPSSPLESEDVSLAVYRKPEAVKGIGWQAWVQIWALSFTSWQFVYIELVLGLPCMSAPICKVCNFWSFCQCGYSWLSAWPRLRWSKLPSGWEHLWWLFLKSCEAARTTFNPDLLRWEDLPWIWATPFFCWRPIQKTQKKVSVSACLLSFHWQVHSYTGVKALGFWHILETSWDRYSASWTDQLLHS